MTANIKEQVLTKKVPPDGGWGWVIVFACGLANVRKYFKIH